MITGLLPDFEIRRLALERGMIAPFEERQRGEGVVSYGLSSYGYDRKEPAASHAVFNGGG